MLNILNVNILFNYFKPKHFYSWLYYCQNLAHFYTQLNRTNLILRCTYQADTHYWFS